RAFQDRHHDASVVHDQRDVLGPADDRVRESDAAQPLSLLPGNADGGAAAAQMDLPVRGEEDELQSLVGDAALQKTGLRVVGDDSHVGAGCPGRVVGALCSRTEPTPENDLRYYPSSRYNYDLTASHTCDRHVQSPFTHCDDLSGRAGRILSDGD